MSLKYFTPLIILVGTFTLNGCNDPKKASESNFKAAAQQYLDANYPKCYVKSDFPTSNESSFLGNKFDLLHVMAKKGLVTEKEVSRTHHKASWGREAHDEIIYSYDLTDEGRKYYKADITKNLSGERIGGFCLGKATVTEVANFTEPSDAMGFTISTVSFSYKVTDIPDWAKSPEITELDRQLQKDVKVEPQKVNEVFLLTNKGWVHEKLLDK